MKNKKKKTIKSIYCIDTENVGSDGIVGINNLSKHDTVVFFISDNSPSIKSSVFLNCINTKAKLKAIYCEVGKIDALDFALTAYICMYHKKYDLHYIISNDTGYDFAIKMYIHEKTTNMFRYTSIQNALDKNIVEEYNKHESNNVNNLVNNVNNLVNNVNKNYVQDNHKTFIDFISKTCGITEIKKDVITEQLIIESFRLSTTKEDLHNNLVKNFGQARGSRYYTKIKTHYNRAFTLYKKLKTI
jgi:hypothetical protein